MKKIIICVFISAVSFALGTAFDNWYYNFDSLFEANKFKRVLVEKQGDALDKAAIVIDNNELLDKDGSDAMAEYLSAVAAVDSLYDTQR